jgi:hypothetical protein
MDKPTAETAAFVVLVPRVANTMTSGGLEFRE